MKYLAWLVLAAVAAQIGCNRKPIDHIAELKSVAAERRLYWKINRYSDTPEGTYGAFCGGAGFNKNYYDWWKCGTSLQDVAGNLADDIRKRRPASSFNFDHSTVLSGGPQ